MKVSLDRFGGDGAVRNVVHHRRRDFPTSLASSGNETKMVPMFPTYLPLRLECFDSEP